VCPFSLNIHKDVLWLVAECRSGKYGVECRQTCRCANGASCDHVTGTCTCSAGWHGADCDRACPAGFYGVDCRHRCQCDDDHQGRCDPVDGTCLATAVSLQCTDNVVYGSSNFFADKSCDVARKSNDNVNKLQV